MQPKAPSMESIAIVGVAGKLPGKASTPSAFWDLILAGETTVSKIPPSRFNVDAFSNEDSSRLDVLNTQYGNFIADDISQFDANFFSIAAQEADAMDPQQRLVLEAAYHAFENAGISMEAAAGSRTGVFIGASSKDYEAMLLRDPEYLAKYHMMGIGTAMLSNRVSYFFDLRGPSFTLDTGCSSSLVALRQACLALEAGECDTALVGGCHVVLAVEAGLLPLSNLGFLSPDGRCWGFDERANGFGRSEGVAFVVIKKLSDAQHSNDHIRAIIRATSLNQDGHTPGITMPSADMQCRNILAAYRAAGLDPQDTQYFEAHGTGTQVGDLVETQAIRDAFQRTSENALYIGSAKKNIGHMEPGAGIVAMLKGIFMLEKGIIPREIDVDRPNPAIIFRDWGIKLSSETIPWPTNGVRRLSINSFGYGGTNAHVILEDARQYLQKDTNSGVSTQKTPSNRTNGPCNTSPKGLTNGTKNGLGDLPNSASSKDETAIFILSASDEGGIERVVTTVQTYLQSIHERADEQLPTNFFHRLAYTINERRSRLPWKTFVTASSISDLLVALSTQLTKPVRSSTRPLLTCVFSGQGANYPGMGLGLLQLAIFRQSIEDCEHAIHEFGSPWSIVDELAKSSADSRVHIPLLAQPLSTALQLALVDLLWSWHIYPSTVIGHSSGEIAAAYAMGAISRRSAMKIAYFRGIVAEELEQKTEVPMTMSSVGLSQEAVQPYIAEMAKIYGRDSVECACINSNLSVTLAGKKSALDALSQGLDEQGIFNRRLAVTVPYHSVHMGRVADQYYSLIAGIEAGSPLPFEAGTPTMFSSLNVGTVTAPQLRDPSYWVRNLTHPVQFLPAFQKLVVSLDRSAGVAAQILEVAPHAVLQRSIKDILTLTKRESSFEYESVLFRNIPALKSCVSVVGRLCCRSVGVSTARVNEALLRSSMGTERLLPLSDLPAYPFNHSRSYWHESRLSRNYRFRSYRTHELIGNRAMDWNALEPRWRNMLKPADVPWLATRMGDKDAVLPPAALLLMPIECFRQLHDYSPQWTAFELEDVRFLRPLALDGVGACVELQTSFHRLGYTRDDRGFDSRYRFTVYAWIDDEPQLLCEGVVAGRRASIDQAALDATQRRLDLSASTCERVVQPCEFLNKHHSDPADQPILGDVRSDGQGNAIASLHVQTQQRSCNDPLLRAGYALHPLALEGLLHLGKAALVDSRKGQICRLYPTSLQKLSITKSPTHVREAQTIPATTTILKKGIRAIKTNTVACHLDHQISISISGLQETSEQQSLYSAQEAPALHCSYYAWKPDIDQLRPDQLVQYAVQQTANLPRPSNEYIDEYETIALHAIQDALEKFDRGKVEQLPLFLQRYWAWMESVYDRATYLERLERMPRLKDPNQRSAYLAAFAQQDVSGELLVETLHALVPILNGEMTGLDLLYTSDLASRFYTSNLHSLAQQRLASIVDLMAHKNPELRIIEVGAGTGGVTGPIMETLSPMKGPPRYSEYCYTDISPSYFAAARERFAREVDQQRMRFQTLDLESPPGEQKALTDHYDVVIAFAVLHATSDIRKTLRHVRSLLKAGGRLVLYEPIVKDVARSGLTFGLIEGWWRAVEPARQLSPILTAEDWHEALIDAGFTGLDCCLPDMDSPDHQWQAVMMSTASSEQVAVNGSPPDPDVVFVVDEDSCIQKDLANLLIAAERQGLRMSTSPLCDLQTAQVQDSVLVFLLEIGHPFLHDLSRENFQALQFAMTTGHRPVLWVTSGDDAEVSTSIFTGLGRTLNTEIQGRSFVELALQPAAIEDMARAIRLQLANLINPRRAPELEVAQRDGVFHIPRIVPNMPLTRHLHNQLVQPCSERRRLQGDGKALTLGMEVCGDFDSFHFLESGVRHDDLDGDEVQVQVKAVGLGSADFAVATGEALGDGFGREFAGVVTRAGAASCLEPGDRVMGCYPSGAMATVIRTKAGPVVRIPESLSYVAAAALPAALQSAYVALNEVARLRPSDRVLILGGTSTVGAAATCMARAIGARVRTAGGDDGGPRRLRQQTAVHQDDRSSPAQDDFDVILDVDDEAANSSLWRALAPGGKYVRVGDGKSEIAEEIQEHCQAISATIGLVNVSNIHTRGDILAKAMRQCSGLADMPANSLVFSASEIKQAFDALGSPQCNNSVVINLDADATVNVIPAPLDPHQFPADATYVVAGGFGGLGRRIIIWMSTRGARSFLVPSRSGATSKAARDLIASMKEKGVRIVACQCDIASKPSFQRCLDEVQATLPPIKGCLQMAMDIQDVVFENMTHAQWTECLAPKVAGTVTLHESLPQGLDFFIMFASIAGTVGGPGQANYAASNTFQDRFARYRRSLGEHAVSINLGVISDAGYVAENDMVAETSRRGMGGMPLAELLVCLEHAMAQQKDYGPNDHLLTGLGHFVKLSREEQDRNDWCAKPLLAVLRRMGMDSSSPSSSSISPAEPTLMSPKALLAEAKEDDDATQIVVQALAQKLSKVLAVATSDIDTTLPVYATGVDSLVALEIRTWFRKEIGAEVSVMKLMSEVTLFGLAEEAARNSTMRGK